MAEEREGPGDRGGQARSGGPEDVRGGEAVRDPRQRPHYQRGPEEQG